MFLFIQGICEPSLRYIACRVAQEVCTVLGDKAMMFKKPFFQRYCGTYSSQLFYCAVSVVHRLQSWYKLQKERYETELLTEDSRYSFLNLALFYAEVFVRVKVVSNYIHRTCNLIHNLTGIMI